MTYKVLLIDDEPSALEGLLLWIDWQELGFEICGTCANGRDGLLRMEELRPDLVITDIHMPIMNGLEMIAAWRERRGPEIQFAILSGYSEFEYAQAAIRFGIHHYLLKPVFPEEAAEELREIRQELERAEHTKMLNQLAAKGEIAALLKGLLLGRAPQPQDSELLQSLSAGIPAWKVYLAEWAPEQHPAVRAQAEALLAGSTAYVLDHEEGQLCVIGSCTGGDAAVRLAALRSAFPGCPVHIAAGTAVSLDRIADSLRTAKEALQHYFYQPDLTGVLDYEDIKGRSFSYRYEHIRLTDALLGAVNTLDTEGFKQALAAAAAYFRSALVAPEAVKKFAIHLHYRMLELVSGANVGPGAVPQADFRLAGWRHPLITLSGLMEHLAANGEAAISTLLRERDDRSHGIAGEINRYIEGHFRESLTIQKLAERFFLHPVYLGQLLIKKNGVPFNEQLHSLRIKEAARKLQEQPHVRLSEIAEAVGYANYSQFLKQFEKKMHMGPNEFRNAKF